MSPKFYFIGFLCCILITQGSTVDGPNPVADTTTIKDAETTEATTTPVVTSEKTTTTESTTTPKTTTTSTPKSTSTPTTATTTTTTTTTPTPKTTPPTTSQTPSTTEVTTTTVPPSTTPAPSPAPLPEPEVGSWVLSNSSTNLTCVIINMALRMKIPYVSTVNQTQLWGLLNLPKNANLTGKCDDDSKKSNISQVRLWWSNNTDYLDITFMRYNESKSFNITRLYLTQNVSGEAFPNNSMKGMMNYKGNGSGLFSSVTVPLGSSYKCSHKTNINLTEVNSVDPKGRNAILTFSKVQIQAFVNSTSGTFGMVFECPGLDTSDIVPIAVGCALAALVIAVLIAYLIGRRRSHARGYLSM